jgi:hypothetical protein
MRADHLSVLTRVLVLRGAMGAVCSGAQLDLLLANGRRVQGTLRTVDAGVLSVVSGHTRVYSVGIELEFEDEGRVQRVRSTLVVPETLRHLVQAGAPCVAVVNPQDPTMLCLVEIKNPYGVPTAVTLGSMSSRW